MKEEKINLARFFLFIVIIIFLSLKTHAHGTIIVSGVEHNEGFIDVKIYIDKKNFLNEEMAAETVRKRASKGKTVIPLSKLHEGTIAVVVYHDEDSNGELKTGFLSIFSVRSDQKNSLILRCTKHYILEFFCC